VKIKRCPMKNLSLYGSIYLLFIQVQRVILDR